MLINPFMSWSEALSSARGYGVRVLFVTDELQRDGGAPLAQLALAGGLASRGHAVALRYLQRGDLLEKWSEFAVTARALPQLDERPFASNLLSKSRYLAIRSWNRMSTAVVSLSERRSRPDVVIANGHGDLQAASEVARHLRAPLVLHLHSPPWDVTKLGRTRQRAFLSASKFVPVSLALRNSWTGAGLPDARMSVVHNGVDVETWHPPSSEARASARASLGLDDQSFMMLYVGRVISDKGVHVLCQAVSDPALADAHLVVAGFGLGGVRTAFEDEVFSSVAGRRFHPLPATPSVLPLYHAADVVVVPSIYPDPFPLVILEAMAAGVPVVTTSAGGCTEGLPDQFLPFVAEPGDPESLVSSLAGIRRAIHAGIPLASIAREHVVENFSLEKMTGGFESVLEEVCA